MPLFSYKVKTESGRMLVGEYKIDSREDLERLLVEKGYTPVEIKEKNAFTDISQISFLKPKVKLKDLAIFCRQFAVVLEAGVPIVAAMDVLRDQTDNRTMRECLDQLYESIQKGISLSSSMKQHMNIFPELLVNTVEAGELSGQLDKIFVKMADHFEKEFDQSNKVKNALTYPVIVLCVAGIVLFILLWKVVPIFAGVLTSMGANLPLITRVMVAIGNVFKNFWYLIILSIVLIVVGVNMFKKQPRGKKFFSTLALKLPVIKGVSTVVMTARFTRTLSTMIASGIHLIQALESVQKVMGNVIIMDKLEVVIEEVKRGRILSQSIKGMGFFPPMVTSMLKIGEESGSIDFTLSKCADFYDKESEMALQRLTTMLGPLITILLGGFVVVIILSILYPMVGMYQSILPK